MQWFKHDTDATQDAKLKKLIIKYFDRGYAIYFHCLELIAGDLSESNLTFELEHDSEIIADNLHIQGTAEKSGIAIVEEIMRYIVELGLFQETSGRIFCFKLLKRLDLSMSSSAKFRQLIKEAKENHDIVMIESCHCHDNIMQDKNRIDDMTIDKKEEPAQAPIPLEAYTFANLLYTLHRDKIDQGYRKTDADIRRWAIDIERIYRIDKRTWTDIELAILWIKTPGQFWAANIMSGKKLREKFPTIWAQMNTKKPGPVLPVHTRKTMLED